MLYKPKRCNECGNEIEPDGMKFFPSQFCEICAPNFKFQRFSPLIWILPSAIMVILGFGLYLKKPDKPLNLSTIAPANASNKNQNAANQANSQISTNNAVQSATQKTDAGNLTAPPNAGQKTLVAKQNSAAVEQTSADEPVYICGAETKKGTACLRKVKGGGRCWQHQGQPAILPPEKLLVSR